MINKDLLTKSQNKTRGLCYLMSHDVITLTSHLLQRSPKLRPTQLDIKD